MIEAVIYQKDGIYQGYEISGHADFAPYGKDIVCAAVSFLAIATENSLDSQSVIESGLLNGKLYCYLDKRTQGESLIRAQAVLKTLDLGLQQISKTYPEHIRLRTIQKH